MKFPVVVIPANDANLAELAANKNELDAFVQQFTREGWGLDEITIHEMGLPHRPTLLYVFA